MKFSFKVTVAVTRAEPPREIEATVEGTPLGIVGRMTATSVTTLTEVGDETKIAYAVDAALTGKLGSLGQPVLRSKAQGDGEAIRRAAARCVRAGRGCVMTPFELAEPKTLKEAVGAARRRRSDRAADRRRHRADADDEGRRVPADEARQPALRSKELISDRDARTASCRIGAMTPLAVLERSRRRCASTRRSSPGRCARCPTSACATSRPSAARSRMPTRTWICRRC